MDRKTRREALAVAAPSDLRWRNRRRRALPLASEGGYPAAPHLWLVAVNSSGFSCTPVTTIESSTIILDDQIGCFAWAILTKVNCLSEKIYGFIRASGFIFGKTLLMVCDRPPQRSFKTAIDPDRNVEKMVIATLKQEDAFQNDHIYVFKGV